MQQRVQNLPDEIGEDQQLIGVGIVQLVVES